MWQQIIFLHKQTNINLCKTVLLPLEKKEQLEKESLKIED